MHSTLAKMRERYGDQVSVILMPMPLDGKCNPRIMKTAPVHANACELAKLALAVWLADRAAFTKLDQWLFESPEPRGPVEPRLCREPGGSGGIEEGAGRSWWSGPRATTSRVMTSSGRYPAQAAAAHEGGDR